jgi:hypothetical protein
MLYFVCYRHLFQLYKALQYYQWDRLQLSEDNIHRSSIDYCLYMDK